VTAVSLIAAATYVGDDPRRRTKLYNAHCVPDLNRMSWRLLIRLAVTYCSPVSSTNLPRWVLVSDPHAGAVKRYAPSVLAYLLFHASHCA
jgi:hypothetical protein